MDMLLAIDIGNSHTVFAIFDETDQLVRAWRTATDSHRTADDFRNWLYISFLGAKIDPCLINTVAISSVVPEAGAALAEMACVWLDRVPIMITTETTMSLIDIEIRAPHEVGADRLANAYAAFQSYGGPAIVIDFGTATTFDVVSSTGAYAGGVIAPGLALAGEAMHLGTAKLPRIQIFQPERVIGRDTVSAMRSGLFLGYVAMVEGMVARIRSEWAQEQGEEEMNVIGTGGWAGEIARATTVIGRVDVDLTLRGVCHIARAILQHRHGSAVGDDA